MMGAAVTRIETTPTAQPAYAGRQMVLWIVLLVAAIVLPWLFYDWTTDRHSGFLLTMLSQMGMMIIFALSYNMLMGQAGLLSFGHAVFFGLGGYCTIHLLNAAEKGGFPIPMEIMPLFAGATGLVFGIVFGYMATKQRAIAFAMITMGIGELIVAAAIMFHHFFGGESGVSANRMIENSLFGLSYASSEEVYYLILGWMVLASLGMLFLTRTPLGAMANAARDNFERAQFMGYDPRRIRFLQFSLSGFFAGIGGGLYAITYEIVTFDAVSGALSANVVLMTYIGGATIFYGPILGATLITLMQSGLSLLSNSWHIYVGVLFVGMVTFAPSGLAGMIDAHGPVARAGRMRQLIVPYIRLLIPGLAVLAGFVALVELMAFLTIGAAQGKKIPGFLAVLADGGVMVPWLTAAVLLVAGGIWLHFEIRGFARLWDDLTADLKERSV
ncbi:MAG: branched-chain amino acid ABC transporter permease [Acetobacteraceae bacterium]|nr:branched-chain amino acid ABC transporter permease [Acetobacteraceae bacterium]